MATILSLFHRQVNPITKKPYDAPYLDNHLFLTLGHGEKRPMTLKLVLLINSYATRKHEFERKFLKIKCNAQNEYERSKRIPKCCSLQNVDVEHIPIMRTLHTQLHRLPETLELFAHLPILIPSTYTLRGNEIRETLLALSEALVWLTYSRRL